MFYFCALDADSELPEEGLIGALRDAKRKAEAIFVEKILGYRVQVVYHLDKLCVLQVDQLDVPARIQRPLDERILHVMSNRSHESFNYF